MRTLAAIALTAALATPLTACGETEDPASTQGGSPSLGAGGERVEPGGRPVERFGGVARGRVKAEIRAALEAYVGASASGDPASACGVLSADARRRLAAPVLSASHTKESCPSLLARVFDDVTPEQRRALGQIEFRSARLDGDRGYAFYIVPGAEPEAIPVRRERGEWKVDAVSGSPYRSR